MIDLSERAKTSECGCQTPLRQQLVLVRVEFTEENFLTCLTFSTLLMVLYVGQMGQISPWGVSSRFLI